MMPMMHILIECLGEPKGHRFQDGEYPIERAPAEIRVVYEVVRYTIDIPGNTNGVDDSHRNQDPPGSHRKHREHDQQVDKVQYPGEGRQRIPFRVSQNLHTIELIK